MRRVTKAEALALLDADRARMPVELRGCVMCALARRDWEPGLVVAVEGAALLRLNRIPSRPAEMMVVLCDHKEKVSDVAPDAYASVFELARAAAVVLEARPEVVRVFVAQLGAPEAILGSWPHLHVHVVPLTEGGEASRPSRVFSWSEAIYAYDEGEAEVLAAELRDAIRVSRAPQ